MKSKLKEELIRLSTDIITSRDPQDIAGLYEKAKDLYEKLAVLKFIEEKLDDIEIDVSKNAIASKFEKLANAVINENHAIPESNPHQEDIMTPGMDTIKDMVSEMPNLDEMLNDIEGTQSYMKNDMDLFMPEATPEPAEIIPSKSLNDRLLAKELKVDLNNRLAFVKHLFSDSTEDYNRVISQLNTIDTQERAISFIENMVKPDYNNWEGKEEYENRLLDLLERKFS